MSNEDEIPKLPPLEEILKAAGVGKNNGCSFDNEDLDFHSNSVKGTLLRGPSGHEDHCLHLEKDYRRKERDKHGGIIRVLGPRKVICPNFEAHGYCNFKYIMCPYDPLN